MTMADFWRIADDESRWWPRGSGWQHRATGDKGGTVCYAMQRGGSGSSMRWLAGDKGVGTFGH